MQLGNSTSRYGAIPQAVHWLTALFVIAGWSLGQFGDDLPRSTHPTALLVHMTPPPPEVTPFGKLVEFAAKLSHVGLYALLIVVPFLGIIVQLKRGHDLPIFGIYDFASPWPADRATARAILRFHAYLADALLILAGIHACAAIVHHHVWRDRTLARMLPGGVKG
jgi:cytochrome b561